MKYCARRNCIYFAVCEWNWYSESGSIYRAVEKRFSPLGWGRNGKNGDPSNWFIDTKVVFNLSLALLSMNIIDLICYHHSKANSRKLHHPEHSGLSRIRIYHYRAGDNKSVVYHFSVQFYIYRIQLLCGFDTISPEYREYRIEMKREINMNGTHTWSDTSLMTLAVGVSKCDNDMLLFKATIWSPAIKWEK